MKTLVSIAALLAAILAAVNFPEMKTIVTLIPVALLTLALLFTGCTTVPGRHIDVAALIEAAGLEKTFEGDVVLHEAVKAPGGPTFDVKVLGLHHNGERWVWRSVEESRRGIWTDGSLTVTPRPTSEQK